MKTKLKQLFVAGLTALTLTYGCTHVNTVNLLHPGKIKNLESLVTSKASDYQVVMFGEQHGAYRKDNDFVIRLLPEMKKLGFNYLALELDREPETITGGMFLTDYASGKLSRNDLTPKNIAKREWVEVINGVRVTVTIKPESLSKILPDMEGWFDIIDAAKREGMKIICYDVDPSKAGPWYKRWNKREELAYKNIKELIFEKNPDVKVVVYCGEAHLSDKEEYNPYAEDFDLNMFRDNGRKYKSLAYYLKEHTQGRTLTVSLLGHEDYMRSDIVLDLKKGVVK